MLPGTCNCDPFARTKGSFCRNLHEQSSFFDGFSASHSCSFHTSGYLVPNSRPFPYFFDNRVGYLCGIDCTSSWRGLDEWNEGERLDRQKRRVASLEPGKVIINEFPSNYQPRYAIKRKEKDLIRFGNGFSDLLTYRDGNRPYPSPTVKDYRRKIRGGSTRTCPLKRK